MSVQKVLSRVPLIVIMGATGSGKTKLSLDLAQKYSGEILSADSMQVYKGLDIVTAKATSEEQAIAPHHLLDVIDPLQTFSVVEFRNRALGIIDDLLNRSKMPIIVGGTNYYIESILWQLLVPSEEKKETDKSSISITVRGLMDVVKSKLRTDVNKTGNEKSENNGKGVPEVIVDDDTVSSSEIHDCLKEVDPKMADRLHPNNRRKVIRALQVAASHERRLSEILEEQHNMDGGSAVGGSLRYPNSIIFWVKPNETILNQRLDNRVDKMMEDGLLKELSDFHERYNKLRLELHESPDYTHGIFQSIGFKEFHKYLMLTPEQQKTEEGIHLLAQGLDDLKLVTRRYARKQKRWIENRLLGDEKRQVPPIYSLDSSDVDQWDVNVKLRAFEIVDAYLKNETCQYEPMEKSRKRKGEPASLASTNKCETCDRTFIGDTQFKEHLNSAKHRKILTRVKKIKTVQEKQDN